MENFILKLNVKSYTKKTNLNVFNYLEESKIYLIFFIKSECIFEVCFFYFK